MRIRERYLIKKEAVEKEIKRINNESDFDLKVLTSLGEKIKELKELYKLAEMS